MTRVICKLDLKHTLLRLGLLFRSENIADSVEEVCRFSVFRRLLTSRMFCRGQPFRKWLD